MTPYCMHNEVHIMENDSLDLDPISAVFSVPVLISHSSSALSSTTSKIEQMFAAIEKGDLPTLTSLLSDCTDVNALKEHLTGRGLLYAAAEAGHKAVVVFLLGVGANPNAKTNYGGTPLHAAAQEGHDAIVELLLNVGADPIAKDDNGHMPLSSAMAGVCAMIHQMKSDNEAEDLAKKEAYIAIFNRLLKAGADPNEISFGKTLLHDAVVAGHLAIVELLIKAGAKLEKIYKKDSNPFSYTPLSWLVSQLSFSHAKEKYVAIVDLLLRSGADPKAGRTLYDAYRLKQTAIVTLLLKAGAANDLSQEDKNTFLYSAAEEGSILDAELLLKAGADPRGANCGKTMLHGAAKMGRTAMVEFLIKAGAEPKATDWGGSTALHEAAKAGHADIVKLLLAAGADPHQPNRDGVTPHYLASFLQYERDNYVLSLIGRIPDEATVLTEEQEAERVRHAQTLEVLRLHALGAYSFSGSGRAAPSLFPAAAGAASFGTANTALHHETGSATSSVESLSVSTPP